MRRAGVSRSSILRSSARRIGIDLDSTISFSNIFSGISIASLIGYLWRFIGKLESRLEKCESRLNNITERLARLEGILEGRDRTKPSGPPDGNTLTKQLPRNSQP